MSLQRNYYEVLGIPSGATTDQIKKKYRELARKFHPDVVQDKALGQKVFSQINQAYRVLVDPERREQYNVTLQPVKQVRPAAPVASPPVAAAKPAATIERPAVSAAPPPKAVPSVAVARFLASADGALMQGKFAEARGYCIKILEIEPGNAKAMEILGDTLVQMGHREEAAVQYRRALQAGPTTMVQAKLNRLEQFAVPTRTRPLTAEPEKAPASLLGRLLGRK